MAAVRKILLNHNLKRGICSTTVSYAKSATSFRTGAMRKILKRDVGKRKWYENKPQRTPVGPIDNTKLTSNHVSRRRTVLNKLFMQHITDLMATGEASTELLGRNIEITHANVTADFRVVLVYWSTKKDSENQQIEQILNDSAYKIRHELTQLRVIGQVPVIKFVKNKQLTALMDLERRMNIADYGDDYEPLCLQQARKPELTLTAKLPPEIKKKILELDSEIEDEETEEDFHVNVPPMRQDVLGLNHHAIMTRVKKSLNKSHEAAKARLLNDPLTSTMEPSLSTAVAGFLTSKDESEAFTEFLRKRQKDEKQKLRRDNKAPVLEYDNQTFDMLEDDDNFFMDNVDKDIDGFEDIDLENLK